MRPGIFVSRTREKLGSTCDQIGRTLEPCIYIGYRNLKGPHGNLLKYKFGLAEYITVVQ